MLFLDTNVVVDLLRARAPRVRQRFADARAVGDPLAISTIVLFELRFGIHASQRPEQNLRVLDAFLTEAGTTIVAFDDAAAVEAAEIRAGLSQAGMLIGPYDVLIAAHARACGATLVTANVREFERVPGLMLTNWVA